MIFRRIAIFCLLLHLPLALASNGTPAKKKCVYDYFLAGTDGKEVPIANYKGKVLLIVNLASQSIYANQIEALKELQTAYADKGLVVIGLPSIDFGKEELSDNAAIEHYYKDVAHINFPVFGKASLRGKDAIPLVRFLTDPKLGLSGGEIHWNFTKFVIDREGNPVIRLEAGIDPSDPEFKVKLEQVLDGKFKKESPAKDASKPSGDDDDDEE